MSWEEAMEELETLLIEKLRGGTLDGSWAMVMAVTELAGAVRHCASEIDDLKNYLPGTDID